MPNITAISKFQQANELNIPLASQTIVANPTLNNPNNVNYLTQLITRVEKSILLNAFGIAMYNELQLALADINNPLYASYKKLVEGDSYDDKVWVGLNNDYSLIAYRIFEEYMTETSVALVQNGNVQLNPEKAQLVSPAYKIANANQKFINQYQGGFLIEPIIYENFVDWFGVDSDNVNVSLYQYLVDKKADFPLWQMEKFKVYETKNTFGL
jgi:basic membrane lipoprotein Med (substrate-binding protein (PBP1-ABC) superfamily)